MCLLLSGDALGLFTFGVLAPSGSLARMAVSSDRGVGPDCLVPYRDTASPRDTLQIVDGHNRGEQGDSQARAEPEARGLDAPCGQVGAVSPRRPLAMASPELSPDTVEQCHMTCLDKSDTAPAMAPDCEATELRTVECVSALECNSFRAWQQGGEEPCRDALQRFGASIFGAR